MAATLVVAFASLHRIRFLALIPAVVGALLGMNMLGVVAAHASQVGFFTLLAKCVLPLFFRHKGLAFR